MSDKVKRKAGPTIDTGKVPPDSTVRSGRRSSAPLVIIAPVGIVAYATRSVMSGDIASSSEPVSHAIGVSSSAVKASVAEEDDAINMSSKGLGKSNPQNDKSIVRNSESSTEIDVNPDAATIATKTGCDKHKLTPSLDPLNYSLPDNWLIHLPVPLSMRPPKTDDYALQFLVEYTSRFYEGLELIDKVLMSNPILHSEYRAMVYRQHQKLVEVQGQFEAEDVSWAFICEYLPHAPKHVVEQMKKPGSILYQKFKAAAGGDSKDVPPDFRILHLLLFGFWTIDRTVVTIEELELAIVRIFPYFDTEDVQNKGKLNHPTGPTRFFSPECGFISMRLSLSIVIERILLTNATCHERLFEIVHWSSKSSEYKLSLRLGFEAHFFNTYGLESHIVPIRGFDELPMELLLDIVREALGVTGKTLRFHKKQKDGNRELVYHENGHYEDQIRVKLPPMKKFLCLQRVSQKMAMAAQDIFHKEFNILEASTYGGD